MLSACLQIYPLDKTLQWQECNIIFTFEKAVTRTGFMLADIVKILSSTLAYYACLHTNLSYV